MHDVDQAKKSGRREFLRKAAVAGGSAAVLATTGKAAAAVAGESGTATPGQGGGYRESDHVRAYYRTARM